MSESRYQRGRRLFNRLLDAFRKIGGKALTPADTIINYLNGICLAWCLWASRNGLL